MAQHAPDGEKPSHLGVSPPLSVDLPSELDIKLSESLMDELKEQKNFEAPEDTNKRNEVLRKLQRLLIQLVQLVGKKKGIPQELLKDAGGKVFTYGSYRLGVYGPGSDIDTLMVAPKHVTREDFFQHMPTLLRKSTPAEELPELTPVEQATVPIIKLEMSGVPVDLIFSHLEVSSVPKNLELTDSKLLRGLSEQDMRSINGTRVTDRILQLVPQSRTFRVALRAIKLWANRRAVYGNVVGFPGGVAYAMMVARVCQLYPKAAAAHIVHKFFFVMSKWNWPSPVVLQVREVVEFLHSKEWDTNLWPSDRRDKMPVITPAYPCMNSTRAVGVSQKVVILRELDLGMQITGDIYSGKGQWKDLFQRHTFFSNGYKHYICVITAATSKDAQQRWSSMVQSRLLKLIDWIEKSDADCVKLVRPFYKGFESEHACTSEADKEKTLDGSLEFQVIKTKTVEPPADVQLAAASGDEVNPNSIGATSTDTTMGNVPTNDGPQKVWTTRHYLGIELQKGKSNLDISEPIKNFKYICMDWDNYNNDVHSIRIKHVRNYDLPDDVFVEGETKPAKKKSKKLKEGTPAAANLIAHKKRNLSNAGLDENQDPAKRRQSGLVHGIAAETNGTATPNGSAG